MKQVTKIQSNKRNNEVYLMCDKFDMFCLNIDYETLYIIDDDIESTTLLYRIFDLIDDNEDLYEKDDSEVTLTF